jgi:predicted transcriptional regulator
VTDISAIQFTERTQQIHMTAALLINHLAEKTSLTEENDRQKTVDTAIDIANRLYDAAISLDKTQQEKSNAILQNLLNQLVPFATAECNKAPEVLEKALAELKGYRDRNKIDSLTVENYGADDNVKRVTVIPEV